MRGEFGKELVGCCHAAHAPEHALHFFFFALAHLSICVPFSQHVGEPLIPRFRPHGSTGLSHKIYRHVRGGPWKQEHVGRDMGIGRANSEEPHGPLVSIHEIRMKPGTMPRERNQDGCGPGRAIRTRRPERVFGRSQRNGFRAFLVAWDIGAEGLEGVHGGEHRGPADGVAAKFARVITFHHPKISKMESFGTFWTSLVAAGKRGSSATALMNMFPGGVASVTRIWSVALTPRRRMEAQILFPGATLSPRVKAR